MIATPDAPRNRRRNALRGASRHVGIQRADVLGVALGPFHGGGTDGDLRASAVLPALAAPRAQCYRDLVFRPAGRFAAEARLEGPREGGDDKVAVIEVAAVLFVEQCGALSKHCVCLRRQLQRDGSRADIRVLWVIGRIARAMAGDELLDLVNVLATRFAEPPVFGLPGRDARQLT